MFICILHLVLGLVLVIAGAELLVKGATSLAKRYGWPDKLIGMTIVAIGTSAPELVVSFIGAAGGNADIAVGNVIGSNICNALLILGVTALIFPLPLTRSNIRVDIPFVIVSTLALCLLAGDTLLGTGTSNTISRIDGAILLFIFAVFMIYSLKSAMNGKSAGVQNSERKEEYKGKRPLVSAGLVILGLAGLIIGGNIMVDRAVTIAKALGVSDLVIAATIVAIGTSLPELATSIVAACRKNVGLALGNVVGSNIINILLILGGSSLITPLSLGNVGPVNLIILCVSALLMFFSAFMFKKKVIDRGEGIIFLLTYSAYIYFLIRS